MTRKKRPFYIIGHNPNTIEEAIAFLENGANAIEPDIVHAAGQFYISHSSQSSYEDVPTVEEYLRSLKEIIIAKKYNLALIIWDIKEIDFDPNKFIAVVKDNFSGGACDGVAMLMTHSDDYGFLNRYNGSYDNVGVGVDESNILPAELVEIFTTAGQKNISYADGITTFLRKPGVFKNVNEAILHRNRNEPDSFKIIYTWVVQRQAALHKYLDAYIDGIMVDVDAVERLKKLIGNEPYSEAYQLAENGYDPFTAAPLPKYLLTVNTGQKFLAGTDAHFLFTITGKSGISLKSLPFNAGINGALEKGSTTYINLEGTDVGDIEKLTIEALSDGIGAGWLPEKISIESKLLSETVHFNFNEGDAEEWITKKGGAVVKYTSVKPQL